MSEPYLVGVIGARGHTGRELLRLIDGHPELMLAYASSREFAGQKVAAVAPEIHDDVEFEALTPEQAAPRRADVVILALPDGAAAPFVSAFEEEAAHRILIDLSADYRFDTDWAYGLPELHRGKITGAKRIANPGCYATAMQLALAPLVELINGAPSVFGVSGFSGAGSKPNDRNNEERLKENLMPYALIGHKHEREASRHLGFDVRFTPHVAPAFRGLMVTAHASLKQTVSVDDLKERFHRAYDDDRLIQLQDEPPTLKDGAGQNGVLIGGFTINDSGTHAVIVAAEDNLLKGAAVQAIQNLNLSLGLPELTGIAF